MNLKMKARVCEGCGESGSVLAFEGRYFHRMCFKTYRKLVGMFRRCIGELEHGCDTCPQSECMACVGEAALKATQS